MLSARLATAAAVAGLTAALLAGCSSAKHSDAAATPTAGGGAASVAVHTEPDYRQIQVVKFLSPTEVEVTPVSSSDSLYGKDFTLRMDAITTPAQDTCGHEESVAFAQKLAGPEAYWTVDYSSVQDDVYVDDEGVHHGLLTSNRGDYAEQMLDAGMARLTGSAPFDYLATAQDEAKASKTGLWGTCPDFSA